LREAGVQIAESTEHIVELLQSMWK